MLRAIHCFDLEKVIVFHPDITDEEFEYIYDILYKISPNNYEKKFVLPSSVDLKNITEHEKDQFCVVYLNCGTDEEEALLLHDSQYEFFGSLGLEDNMDYFDCKFYFPI